MTFGFPLQTKNEKDPEVVKQAEAVEKLAKKLATLEKYSTEYYAVLAKSAYANNTYDTLVAGAVEDMAIIHVYYRELGIVQYVRDELYSIVDFIGGRRSGV